MQTSEQAPPGTSADAEDGWPIWAIWLVAIVVFFIFSEGLTAVLKAAFGPWADLTPNFLWWMPVSIGIPGYLIWEGWKRRRRLKLHEWALAYTFGLLVLPFWGFFLWETFSYAADMTLPLDEHRVNVTRVYKWNGTKSPSEWRLVDDKGRTFRFPAFVTPKIKPGPAVIKVTRLRNMVLYAEPAQP